MVEMVFRRAHEFDVIHFHSDYLHFPITRRQPVIALTTLHGRLDIPELGPLFQLFRDTNLVSISNAQRQPLPFVNWVGTVYHGLPIEQYRFQSKPGSYLDFLGRISPEKRVDRTNQIAMQAGTVLKLPSRIN